MKISDERMPQPNVKNAFSFTPLLSAREFAQRGLLEIVLAGQLAVGTEAIQKVFAELVAAGRKFDLGDQQAAIVSGELALTSTCLSDGTVTSEIARRQSDGTWLWVIDRFSIT